MALFKVVLLLSLLSLPDLTFGYRPIIIFHGIFASYSNMDGFTDMIEKAHPGTQVMSIITYIYIYIYIYMYMPLWLLIF